MDSKLSATEVAFRDELRAWLERHCPRDWERTRHVLSREARAESLIGWQRELHAGGYVGLHWPVAYGGRRGTVMEQSRLPYGVPYITGARSYVVTVARRR